MQAKRISESLLELRRDPRLQMRERRGVVHTKHMKDGCIGVVSTILKTRKGCRFNIKGRLEPIHVPDLQTTCDETFLDAGELLIDATHVHRKIKRRRHQLHANAVTREAPGINQITAAELDLMQATHCTIGTHAILPREALSGDILLRMTGVTGPTYTPMIRGKGLIRAQLHRYVRVIHLRERVGVHRWQQQGVQNGCPLQIHNYLKVFHNRGICPTTPCKPQQQEGGK